MNTMGCIQRASRALYTYLKYSMLARLETGVTTHKLVHQEVLGMWLDFSSTQ